MQLTLQEKLRQFLDPNCEQSDEEYAEFLRSKTPPQETIVGQGKQGVYAGWPFDGSFPEDGTLPDLDVSLILFAQQHNINHEGTRYVSKILHYKFTATDDAQFDDIDAFLEIMRTLKIPACVEHRQRPGFSRIRGQQKQTAEEWVPPVGMERGTIPKEELKPAATLAREAAEQQFHRSQIAKMDEVVGTVTTGVPLPPEITQDSFPIDNTLRLKAGPNTTLQDIQEVLTLFQGGDQTTATAYPSDIEERRAAFAAEQHQKFQVICDETNNPPDVVETGDLNVDILLDLNHVSAKLSDMGISWQGGSSQNINTEYAVGYAKHVLQLRDDHGVDPEPVTLIDGKLVASDTKKENHARVIDLFRYAADAGIGKFSGQRPPFAANTPKGSQIVIGYDVSPRQSTSVQTVMRKDADGNFHVLSTHTISALDVARITDKQNRRMQHCETAEFLSEMRKESGSTQTVSPSYVAAMNAKDARAKQKKVKTKTRNKRAKR